VGRVTIKELHKRNMTGEELNKIMWGRADIATPVRVLPDEIDDLNLLPTDALTSALDTIAFAADLPLPTSGLVAPAPPANIGAHKGAAPPRNRNILILYTFLQFFNEDRDSKYLGFQLFEYIWLRCFFYR